MLEAGFCRSRETVNVLMECIVDTCLCGLLFYALGFRVHVQPRQRRSSAIELVLPARCAGDLRAHRRGVPGVLAVPVCVRRYLLDDHFGRDDRPHRLCRRPSSTASRVSGFIYPIIGHWAWGPDGFLATMGSAGNFLPRLGHGLPRFRGFDRGSYDRRLRRSGRRHRARSAPRTEVQARRRRTDAAARSDHRRVRRPAFCGSAGTVSIPAARFRRWISKASDASPRTRRWPPAPPA